MNSGGISTHKSQPFMRVNFHSLDTTPFPSNHEEDPFSTLPFSFTGLACGVAVGSKGARAIAECLERERQWELE
tara:strand:- start:12 stop:233 length:222 start_codon:yes stop_codon:yes gene_type:complete